MAAKSHYETVPPLMRLNRQLCRTSGGRYLPLHLTDTARATYEPRTVAPDRQIITDTGDTVVRLQHTSALNPDIRDALSGYS